MGDNTEYLGHLTITPRLNPAEVQWLLGFADWAGGPGADPFSLPMNPRAELAHARTHGSGAVPPHSRIPWGVSDWQVSFHGDRLRWSRAEKSHDAVATLEFLADHFLGPAALAKQSTNPDFADFTFDHRLDGVIAGCREDTDELFLLWVENSVVTWETVVPGTPPW